MYYRATAKWGPEGRVISQAGELPKNRLPNLAGRLSVSEIMLTFLRYLEFPGRLENGG